MPLLRLNEIVKYYPIGRERFKALHGVSVDFEAGELVSIIGESGSGKSTLMNLIGALDLDYDGEILVDGKDIHAYDEKQRDQYRKNTIGFIFQSFNLIPHLSVLDNVTIAMTLSGVPKDEKIAAATKMLARVGLEEQLHKRPNQLSGGQKQRVAIARALVNNPSIILADEPTGALDSETTEQVLDIIKEIAAEGKLVIMVTHSAHVASESQRVVEMKDGRIIKDEVIREEPSKHLNVHLEEKPSKDLSFRSAVFLALENMRAKISRNILVALGASIGISSVISMLSVGNGVVGYMNAQMNSASNPQLIEVNVPVVESESAIPTQQFFTSDQIYEVCNISYIDRCEEAYSNSSLSTNKLLFGQQTANLPLLYTYNSTVSEANIVRGALPTIGEILVSENYENEFGTDLIGQQVTARIIADGKILERDFTVSGIYSFSTNGEPLPQDSLGVMFLYYEDLASMYEAQGLLLQPTVMYVHADSLDHVSAVKEQLQELGYSGSVEEVFSSIFMKMINMVSTVLAAISGTSIFVSAIMILVVLYISVVERTREIGVLKAIGARRKDIRRIFVSEAFLIGLFSGLVAILSSYVVAGIANVISQAVEHTDIILIEPGYLFFGMLVSIVISMIAGLFPAAKAAKLDPVESLRHE